MNIIRSEPVPADSSRSIIVGGGMVGLTLALLVAQEGLPVLLLESASYPHTDGPLPPHASFDARNTALSRRTVQIFTDLGLMDTLAPYATPIYDVLISEEGGFGKAHLNATQEQVDHFGYVVENAALGQVLLRAVRQQPLIELRDGRQVTHLAQTNAQVRLTARHTTGDLEHYEAPLVMAADGKNSTCRRLLDIEAREDQYNQVALVAVVETDKAHRNQAFERFSINGPLALLPLSGGHRRSVVWIVKDGDEQALIGPAHDAQFLQVLQDSYGDRAGRFIKTGPRSSYPLSQVLAEQQVRGRVVLMGNAAHTLHPVAGQGFNLCVRDALALTQMLTNHRRAAADLGGSNALQAYQQARLADQKRVIRFCDTVVRGFSHPNPLLKLARNTGLVAFDRIPGIKPLVARYAMGLKS